MIDIYFSDYFDVDIDLLEEYGAFDISLAVDLPLFIDPFLLFNSKKEVYQELHKSIIKYLVFLRDKSISRQIDRGLLKAWYMFPEVKQNWLGFTREGNSGSGLGMKFAVALNRNLGVIFSDFGEERVTEDSHLEKLCLINSGVGRDNISDFATNLIKEYLLNYTQDFALKHLDKSYLKDFVVNKVRFNYTTESWVSDKFTLPTYNDDYVLLTPKDMLTKDDTFMNSNDMFNKIELIASSVDNDILRASINNYLRMVLRDDMKSKERKAVYESIVSKYPHVVDYYIRAKERAKEEASTVSRLKISFSERAFIENVTILSEILSSQTDFYKKNPNSYEEAYERVTYLKDVIENKDGYRIFYDKGQPIKKESDIQVMFKLTCIGAVSDINAEVNNGRGPVDFKSSIGSTDKTLIEFKLASNGKLKQNLKNQVEVYKKANNTNKSIKVIVYFSEQEYLKVRGVLKELELENDKNVVLIDARLDNKPSASNAS